MCNFPISRRIFLFKLIIFNFPSASAGDRLTSTGDVCHAAGARANLTRFLDAAASRGLFVILRIGPFICGEWSYGGIPSWINGLTKATRAHNHGWESAMVRP